MTFNGFGINFPLFTHFCLLTRAHTHTKHTQRRKVNTYTPTPRARESLRMREYLGRRRRRRSRSGYVSLLTNPTRLFFPLLLCCAFISVDGENDDAFDESRRGVVISSSEYLRPESASEAVELKPSSSFLLNNNNHSERGEKATTRSGRRRLSDDGDDVDDDDKTREGVLKPKQVHLSITGDEEVTVVWTTSAPLDEEKDFEVKYACAMKSFFEEHGDDENVVIDKVVSSRTQMWHSGKVFESSSYTQQMCLASATSLTAPSMGGPRTPVSRDVLAKLANTSSWADTDASNYNVVNSFEDVVPNEWFTMGKPWEKTVCLGYANANGGWYRSPFIHKATIKDLNNKRGSDMCVYLLPHDEDENGKKVYRSFKKRGSSNSNEGETILSVMGDTGQTEVTKKVFQHVKDVVKPHAVIHTGDVSYADGFAPRWDSFAEVSEALFSSVPVVIASGNHDVVNSGAEYTAFEKRYETPWRRSASYTKNFWSFNVGKAHVVHIDSYSSVSTQMFDGAIADTFQTWLENDLERVNRKQTPWIIAVFHAPWYNSNSAHYKENEPQRQKYEQILYKFGVDVAVNGHVHSYERSHPVYNGQRNACGVTHIVVGDGGNYEGPYGASWMTPQPSWSAFREGSFGAGSLIIHNDTHMSWKWERNACVHPDGTTDLNHTYWSMRDGESASSCRTDPDISENALVPVDTYMFIKNENECENRKMGSGSGGEKLAFTEIDDDEEIASNSDDLYRIQSLTVALAISLVCLGGTCYALWKTTQALRRAKFAVSVHAAHMDNNRIRDDEYEEQNGLELNISNSFHAAQDVDEGDEMLLFAGTGQNRITSSSSGHV